jgi:hypothetical protein
VGSVCLGQLDKRLDKPNAQSLAHVHQSPLRNCHRTSGAMATRRRLPDIVVDTRLESEVHAEFTIHSVFASSPVTSATGAEAGAVATSSSPVATKSRPGKIKERWRRVRQLGSGGYGTVWLERCSAGSQERVGTLRAVKEIRCDVGRGGGGGGNGKQKEDRKTPSEECARELEAIGKFSQAAVSLSL